MSKSNKQDYITGDKFIGDNDHYCLSYIYIYICIIYWATNLGKTWANAFKTLMVIGNDCLCADPSDLIQLKIPLTWITEWCQKIWIPE